MKETFAYLTLHLPMLTLLELIAGDPSQRVDGFLKWFPNFLISWAIVIFTTGFCGFILFLAFKFAKFLIE